jgi:uncharacterized membrane protein
MKSRVQLAGHAVHPILVVFPLGLFVTGFIFDVVHQFTDNGTFSQVGFWCITVGLIGSALAALTGLADWTKIPTATRARSVGLRHGILNAVVALAFLISWILRVNEPGHAANAALVVLELLAVAIATVAAWLGGELVERLAIGVDADAHPNASSSLAGRSTASTMRTRAADERSAPDTTR